MFATASPPPLLRVIMLILGYLFFLVSPCMFLCWTGEYYYEILLLTFPKWMYKYFIAPDKRSIHINIFPISIWKHVMGTHNKKHLSEVLLMSTHNICFYGEIRKNWYFLAEKKNQTHLIWSYNDYHINCTIFLQTCLSKQWVPINEYSQHRLSWGNKKNEYFDALLSRAMRYVQRKSIALDKGPFSTKNWFSYFSTKSYVVNTAGKFLPYKFTMPLIQGASSEYHNIRFHGKIKKILCG